MNGLTGTGLRRLLLTLQGLYFLATGIWPLIHMPSFLWITGPKTDLWLVTTVGVLVAVIGLTLLAAAAWSRRARPETLVLAIGSALGLAGIDLTYVLNGTISPVYLLDAFAELLLVLFWGVSLLMPQEEATAADTLAPHPAETPAHTAAPFPHRRPLV